MIDFKETVTFFYESADDGEVDKEIHMGFDTYGGIHISEFHRMCKRFAYVMGFAPENVEKYFGEDTWED